MVMAVFVILVLLHPLNDLFLFYGIPKDIQQADNPHAFV